jgi:hypothetical protein
LFRNNFEGLCFLVPLWVKVSLGEGGYGMAGACFTGVCYIVRKTTTRNMQQIHAGKGKAQGDSVVVIVLARKLIEPIEVKLLKLKSQV